MHQICALGRSAFNNSIQQPKKHLHQMIKPHLSVSLYVYICKEVIMHTIQVRRYMNTENELVPAKSAIRLCFAIALLLEKIQICPAGYILTLNAMEVPGHGLTGAL